MYKLPLLFSCCKYASLSIYFLFLVINFSSVNAQPTVQWKKTYGGGTATATDNSVVQTTDGGYMVAGSSAKNGKYLAALKKLGSDGTIIWQKTYGGSYGEAFYSVQQTSDGGYIAAGISGSNDGDVTGHHGATAANDYWVVKTDASGNIQWQKSLGGTYNDVARSIVQTSDGGYIVAGESNSIDGNVTGLHVGAYAPPDAWIVKLDGTGSVLWQKALGGIYTDRASSVKQTTDGGYIVAGSSRSNDGDVSGHHGTADFNADCWVVKTDASGNILWQKSLGGTADDVANSVIQTTDGGYILAAYSFSNDGDASGHHGLTSTADYWVVKTDASGNILWQKSLGGTKGDYAYSVRPTSDGGYIVAGNSSSVDGDVTGLHGTASDAWIVKLDGTGTLIWQKALGGTGSEYAYEILQTSDGGYIYAGYSTTLLNSFYQYWIQKLDNTGNVIWQKNSGASGGDEYAYSIQQTTDGGYIIAGDANTDDGDVSGLKGGYDFWVVKTDATGTIQWQKTLGGSGDDYGYAIQQTTDGGYIVTGETYSTDGDATGNHGLDDAFVIKLDALGNKQWSKVYGGTNIDYFNAIQQTTDGGYIATGSTYSNNGDVSGNHGNNDYWVVKLNSSGVIQWQKCLGGTGYDYAYSIKTTSDGGYIVAGDVSSNDGDVTGNHSASYDYWIVKLDGSGTIQWQKTYGGTAEDDCRYIQQTADGGYIATGFSLSVNGDLTGNHGIWDYWVIKISATGTLQWQKSLGGSSNDYSYSIKPATGGGYIVAGRTNSNNGDVSGNHGDYDYWILKLDSTGTVQWKKILGGTLYDIGRDVQQTSDGGYVVIGSTTSNNGDVSGNHGQATGGYDWWIVKLSSGLALPVNLISFTAQKQQTDVLINWETANQLNFSHYEIERSLDAIHFEIAGRVQPLNGSGTLNYQFKDLNAVNIYKNYGRLFYRLKMVDIDQMATCSKIAKVDFDTKYTVYVYPNPASDKIYIEGIRNYKYISITDVSGKKVYEQKITQGSETINISNLKKGVYFMKFINDNSAQTQKLIKE